MVCVAKRKELGAIRFRTVLLVPVLKGEFHRNLDGTGTVAGEENVL
jgi:hypothetical protein